MPWLALALGLALSAAVALVWRSEVQQQARRSFDAQAASVGAAVTTSLLRMDDLTIGARTLIASNPDLTNRRFADWYANVDARRRYPGTVGFGFMRYVRAAELPAYEAQVRADPIPGVPPLTKGFAVIPPGPRPGYCLIRLGVAGLVNRLIPNGYALDVCALPGTQALAASLDSGRFATLAARIGSGMQLLIVAAPVYRGRATPATAPERRAAMRGWAIGVFDLRTVLGAAVGSNRDLAVTVGRSAEETERRSSLGAPSTLSTVASLGSLAGKTLRRQFTLDADGRWLVTVAKKPSTRPASPTVQAIVAFSAGALVSVLLFLLLRLLVAGRARALRIAAQRSDELRHQALHDALTGLPNRALILDRAQQLLARGRRTGAPVGAMFVDLDGFKSVNDTFGHRVGDMLLRAVGERLAGVLRESDSVGRMGGDEFVVLVDGADGAAGPEVVAERLLAALREPFPLGAPEPVSLAVTASIGVVVGERADAEELLRDADIAMYEAKAAGKNRYVVFRPEMHAALRDRLRLDLELRNAVEAGQLRLLYQPTFDLAEGTVIGVEALLRWQHPTRGTITPATFIPIAEENGQILPIGRWVLAEACRQGADWHRRGHRLDISVNVSGRQLDDPGLPDAVLAALESSGLDPSALVLEITESTLIRDTDAIVPMLERLKQLGVRIAIDDFGTGYSSLSYLQRLPVDAIKIDRTFISEIGRSPESTTIIRALVQLAKTLELATIAEGIEEHAQLSHLRREACDAGQGYLLARTLELEEIEALLTPAPASPPSRRAGFRPAPSAG